MFRPEKYATTIEDSDARREVTWRLYTKKGAETGIQLPEEEFTDLERELLETWMNAERREEGELLKYALNHRHS